MRKLALLALLVCSIGTVLALPATADDNKTVNAMVTPKVISITVSTTTLQYGTLSVGSTNNIPTPASVGVTNTGTAPIDIQVRAANSTPGGWTPANTPGANIYRHEIDTSSTSSGGTFDGALKTTAEDIYNDVLAGQLKSIFFRLDMPTSSTSLDEQTLPIVITALEAQ